MSGTKTKYPTCTTYQELASLPSGSIVYLHNWLVQQYPDTTVAIYDGVGGRADLLLPPEWLIQKIRQAGGLVVEASLHVEVRSAPPDYGAWFGASPPPEVWFYAPKPRKCDCGASHTFLQHHHTEWCASNELE